MAALLAFPEPVVFEVLQNLQAKELGPCASSSRSLLAACGAPLLWFRVYCAAYRGHFTPPPTFKELAAGKLTGLGLEKLCWRSLARHRASQPAPRLVGALTVCDASDEFPGAVEVEYRTSSGARGSARCMVLQQPLQPLPLARPVAYVELLLHGGASVGLVDNVAYNRNAHVGWFRESLGYHGDDGQLHYVGRFKGLIPSQFGPTFGLDPTLVVQNDATQAPRQADVVGVGIDYGPDYEAGDATREWAEPEERRGGGNGSVFFTKNGVLVGSVPWPSPNMRHFAFGLHRQGDRASVNVGARRFFFDVEAYSQTSAAKLQGAGC